jgi:hypothetical protein
LAQINLCFDWKQSSRKAPGHENTKSRNAAGLGLVLMAGLVRSGLLYTSRSLTLNGEFLMFDVPSASWNLTNSCHRSDWQLEIKGLEFHEASSVDNALRSFSNSIVFQRTNYFGDIRARPEKKVVFPSSPPVSEYVEKSAIRYHIKGTKYIFEIARYDEYKRSGAGAYCGEINCWETCQKLLVHSGGICFDANWDNLLGGHANLPKGQSAKYSLNLATFFPSKEPLLSLKTRAKASGSLLT